MFLAAAVARRMVCCGVGGQSGCTRAPDDSAAVQPGVVGQNRVGVGDLLHADAETDVHPPALEQGQRVLPQVWAKFGHDRIRDIDQDPAHVRWPQLRVLRQQCGGESGHLGREFHAGVAGADDQESQSGPPSDRIADSGGHLDATQHVVRASIADDAVVQIDVNGSACDHSGAAQSAEQSSASLLTD